MENNEVRLHMDCGEAETKTFRRSSEKLSFSQNSGIFIANAGNTGLTKFVVSKSISAAAFSAGRTIDCLKTKIISESEK